MGERKLRREMEEAVEHATSILCEMEAAISKLTSRVNTLSRLIGDEVARWSTAIQNRRVEEVRLDEKQRLDDAEREAYFKAAEAKAAKLTARRRQRAASKKKRKDS